MQSGVPGRHPVTDLWTSVLQYLATFVAGLQLRVALGDTTVGLPVHLAATAQWQAAGSRLVGGGAVDEEIDPEVVEQVRAAQEGSAYAFALLYDRYVDRVYAYCYHRVGNRQIAEDLTSDVFMRALRRISSFSWQGKDFGAWLLTIARNRCHDHFKSARFRLEMAVDEVYDAPTQADGDSPEHRAVASDVAALVQEALTRLKSEHAEVLYHRFIAGLDVPETAQIMGKKEGAIRALQYRALKALAKHVDVEELVAA